MDANVDPWPLSAGSQGAPSKVVTVQLPDSGGSHNDQASLSTWPGVEASVQPLAWRSALEVTFTPTAAGHCAGEGLHPTLSCDIQALVSETISKILTTGHHQGIQFSSLPMAPQSFTQPSGVFDPDDSSQQDSVHSEDSLLDDEDRRDMEFSDDEGMLPDRLAFTGLFHPSLFKSLLHKAKVTTHLAALEGQPDQQEASHLHDELFTIPKVEQEFIPCLQLFTEVVQRPWNQPGSLVAPNG